MKFKEPYTKYEGKWIIWKPAPPYKGVSPKYFLIKFLTVKDRVWFSGVIVEDEVMYGAKVLNFPKNEEKEFFTFKPEQDDYEDVIKNIWTKKIRL